MSAPFHRAGWVAASNIYEVNLRQYTREGTFGAFARHLPRLRDMGIEILWFMPITPISLEKRKGDLGSYYACSDYTATNPEFGTLADFRQLVDDAHALGFKIIIDWVANHTGWDHRWTREHPDFYRKNQDGQFYEAHGWEDVIDLNFDNGDLRRAMIDAMAFWLRECNIDGFRCDMAMLVPLEFWREARTQLDMGRELFWLAECEEIAYHEVFDTSYAWKFLHKMEAVWRRESGLDGLDEVLQYYATMFPTDATRALFTSNHDENSHSGSEYERMGDMARAFSVLCCTWPGIPLIYSGQELPNLRRLRFFEKDCIEWREGADGNDPAAWAAGCELHHFYKTLLALRGRNRALCSGDPEATSHRLHVTTGDRCWAFLRRNGDQEVLVLLNFSAGPLVVASAELLLKGTFADVFSGVTYDLAAGPDIELAAWGYLVLEKK